MSSLVVDRVATFSEIFVNPATGKVYEEGDTYYCLALADTLERIAVDPEDFYSGETARMLLDDLTALGGLMTMEDLETYTCVVQKREDCILDLLHVTLHRPEWLAPLSAPIGDGFMVHSVPPPASGAILIFWLHVLKYYNFVPEDECDTLTYHRLVEALKWAYAERTHMGDPFDPDISDYMESVRMLSKSSLYENRDTEGRIFQLVSNLTSTAYAFATYQQVNDLFTVNDAQYYGADYYNPPDHGTSHISVIGPNGDAVAVTSTINLL